MRHCLSMALPLCFCILANASRAKAEITYADQLRQMTDLDQLWMAPKPGERCIQFSSYNRTSDMGPSMQEARPGWPEGWYANNDRGVYLRSETRNGEKEYVHADVEGPGSVVRIWSANPSGILHFYIDGATEPTWSVDFEKLTSGEVKPFVEPFAGVRGMGYNFHGPVPFATHLKITCSHDDHHFEENIRLYPKDTAVESFRPELIEQQAELIEATREMLLKGPALGEFQEHVREGQLAMDGNPADPSEWTEATIPLQGPLVIREIAVKIGPDATGKLDYPNLLRRVLLCVELDLRRNIRVPVSDFFGSAPGFKPYQSYPMVVTEDGWGICRFPMPIPETATVGLVADGPLSPIDYQIKVKTEQRELPDDALTFHASWHLRKQVRTRPISDFRVLNAMGPGRFVGCCLNLANPSESWWGEGDEKFYVDGEKFPSTFGTGTEDYFGYAFADPSFFASAYHAQPQCDGPGNAGYTCLDRFQIPDAVPFQTRFLFDMEIFHWQDVYVDYATTAYWYGHAGADSGLPYVPDYDYRTVDEIEPQRILQVPGALEGEALKVRSVTGGEVETPWAGYFGQWKWSNRRQLFWKEGKPGDKLVLDVPVEKAGRYRVEAVFTVAPDYAIVQLRLDGKPLGKPLDCFVPHVGKPGRRLNLGTVQLPQGDVPLEIEITGKNDRAVPEHFVGLDYLRLIPVEDGDGTSK